LWRDCRQGDRTGIKRRLPSIAYNLIHNTVRGRFVAQGPNEA
jgi:hypothetical protein